MTTNIEIANSQPNLNQITQKIIGETCHQVRFSYGDELILDFGEMKPYNHPKLAHLRKGTWQLSTRATNYLIKVMEGKRGYNIGFSSLGSSAKSVINFFVKALENKKLTDFVIVPSNNFKLTLSFDDGCEFILDPNLTLEDDSGLAYWELLMPNEQILIVGPGQFWECKSIHEIA